MFNLTRQEKLVLLFICCAGLLGLGLNLLFKYIPQGKIFYQTGFEARQIKLDINKATIEELAAIKGLGPQLASRIVDFRAAAGGFKRLDELLEVRGIKAAKFEKIKDQLFIKTSSEEYAAPH